jgi:hypothetical protein
MVQIFATTSDVVDLDRVARAAKDCGKLLAFPAWSAVERKRLLETHDADLLFCGLEMLFLSAAVDEFARELRSEG